MLPYIKVKITGKIKIGRNLMKHKKSKKYINSADAKRELKKFINFAGSVKEAAILLGSTDGG
jgi:hypothetical protein